VDSKPDATPRLQFESAIDATESEDSAERRALAAVICGACQSAIPDAYFDVNGTTVCGSCRDEIARQAETPRGMGTFALASLFGIGAAVAGAALYYAVIAITNFEIGLVAIAIGYMVGFAVRKGAGGGGGRRFQVVAILLTYWAVGLAYVPLAFKDSPASRRAQPQAEQAGAAVAEPAEASRDDGEGRRIGFGFAAAMLLGFTFVLPVLAIAGSMPSGLISAAIIAFGMHQAWRMTGAPQLVVTGPYQISSNPSPAS